MEDWCYLEDRHDAGSDELIGTESFIIRNLAMWYNYG